uniref:FGENESH: predicted gene_4.215 protein n=1 Tax=Rhodotorula toruloides TaxID=5286 RepID=A0A0K3CCD9_RHOTO
MSTNVDQSVYLFLRNVSPLDEAGAGWKGWKLRMERALRTGNVYEHVSGDSVRPSQEANADAARQAAIVAAQRTWDNDDARAINYMVSKLPDNIAGQLLDLTARQIWVHLASRFDLGNKESIQSILAAIRSLKAKNLEAVGPFLDEHEEILSRAREIDFPLVRPIPTSATDEQRSQYGTLHYVYSDFILEGLPSDTEWKAWTSVYRQAASSTFAPREVLDKVRAEYNRRRANVAAASGGLLLNGNGKMPSLSSTAAATVGKGSSSGKKPQQQQQPPKRKFCQEENPRHSVERCWQNPDNPNNRLKEGSGSAKGKGKEKEKEKKDDKKDKDKDGKVVTLATAAVASSVDGDFNGSKAPTDWHLDTCASRHIVAERRYFISYRLMTTPIVTASGPSIEGVGVGTAEIEVETSSGRFKIQLKDAIHVPTSAFNLISAPRFINAGYKLEFAPGGAFQVISPDYGVVLEGKAGKYSLPEVNVVSATLALLATSQEECLKVVERVHRCYGHPSKAAMRDLLRLGEVKGFTTTDLDVFFSRSCPPCRTGKLTKSSFPIIERQATLPLQRLHSDLAGKFPFTSFGGAQYFIIVRDEASGYIDGEPLKDKTEALEAFKRVYFRMKAKFESSKVEVAKSTTLQTDNGSEYTSRAFQSFLAGEGISHRLLIPYMPQQNGLSKRAVRTVKEKVATLLSEADFSKKYWAEVFFFALFIINNLPYLPNGGETPYHYLHHARNPFFDNLSSKTPILGQQIWIHDPDAGTFDDKSYKGIFLGVGQHRGVKGFRVQAEDDRGTNRMLWSRNISFAPGDYVPRAKDVDDEEELAWVEQEEDAEEGGAGMPPIEEQQQEEIEGPAPGGEPAQPPKPGARKRRGRQAPQEEEEDEGGLRRGSRVRKQATHHLFGHNIPAGAAIALVNVAVEPSDDEDTQFAILNVPQTALATKKTFSIAGRPVPSQPSSTKEALSSVYSTEWKDGMNEEWTGFQQQDVVGDLVPREPGMKVLGTRWHHTARVDSKSETAQLKSRLVVQGVKTIPFLSSFGPTFTPLPRWDVISLFFVLATHLKLPVYVTDFAKAYLSAQVPTGGDTVFVKQPPGFEVPGREDYVYQLKRAAYGLPQSGRAFHLKVKDKLDQLDFVSLSDGVTLYTGRRGGDYVVLVIYVDDGLIAGKKALVEDVVGELQEDFDVTFSGSVDGKTFLGRDVKHDPQTGSVRVSVKSQIEKALKMHGFENLKPLHMPIQPGIVYVEWDGEAIKPNEYLSAVGSLLFIATTRVDIQYAVGVASRYSSNPGPKHWELVKRIFAYLSATRDVALEMGLSRSDGSGLVAFVDADHGGDVDTRRSTTGVVVQLDGTTILTISRRQSSVQLSTFQAELNAVVVALGELEWISSVISSLPIGNDAPLHLFNDNLSAVNALLSPTYIELKKQHDLKLKYIREQVEKGFVDLRWIPGADNVADILTKALPARCVREIGTKLGLVGWPEGKVWGSPRQAFDQLSPVSNHNFPFSHPHLQAIVSSAASTEKGRDDGMSKGALLRTNVALRLPFLYHRVAPLLIAMLKFGFAKYPQTYAQHARPASSNSADSTDAQGSSGLLAVSSSYALRLAAMHPPHPTSPSIAQETTASPPSFRSSSSTQKELAIVGQLVDVLEETLPKEERLVGLLRDSLAGARGHWLVGGAGASLATRLEALVDDEIASAVSTLSPVKQNVFASFTDSTQLQRDLPAMPLPLVILHARTTDLPNPSIAQTILDLVSASSYHVPVARLLMHHFVNGVQALEIAALVVRICSQAGEAVKKEIKEMLVAQEGLLGVFKRDWLSSAVPATQVRFPLQCDDSMLTLVRADMVRLLGQLLDSTVSSDIILVQPFCDAVLADLTAVALTSEPPAKKRKRRPSPSPPAAGLSPRVLAASPLLPFSATTSSLPFLEALLSHFSADPTTLDGASKQLLGSAFSRTVNGLEKAGDLLVKGADALLPFSTSSATRSKELSSLPKADERAAKFVTGSTVSSAQAKTLAALVYRSSAARDRFIAWLAEYAAGPDLIALSAPQEALVEVAEAKGDASAAIQPAIVAALVQHLATLPARADAEALRAVATLVSATSFDTPKEDEEDGEEVKPLVEELTATFNELSTLSLTSNALSPLVTAITTRRLDQPYATAFGTALCKQQQLKDNEITHHLNEIFASPRFHAFTSNPTDSAAVSSVLALVFALASSLPTAAAKVRSVERLVPLCRGALSMSNVDRFLLDTSQAHHPR